jgi:hypothetical protein
MISKIKHLTSSKIIERNINYHEKKVEKGLGTLLSDNTFSENKEERLSRFENVINSNGNIKTNLAFEVCLSFPRSENISDEKFKNILNEYIKGMGYDNAPYVCYRHDDKEHQHYHTIISHIDWEGKKIPQYNMFLKSQKLCRELEVKHELRVTEYNKNITDESLNAIDARKYYFSNALAKALKVKETPDYLKRNMSKEQIEFIIKHYKKESQLTNTAITSYLGKEKAEAIKYYLNQKGMFNNLFKDELYDKVETCYNKSENKTEFLNQLEKDNIYIRKLYNNNKAPYFVYGLKDVSFYIRDSDLAKEFTFNNLFEVKVNEIKNDNEIKSFDVNEQKKYIKVIASRILKESKSLKEYSEKLNTNGIELITYENKRGIYGIAFKSTNILNPEVIKGSEVNLPWKGVETQIQNNNEIISKEIIGEEAIQKDYEANNYYIPYIPESIIKNKGQESEDFLKKKKKKKPKNRDMDHGI